MLTRATSLRSLLGTVRFGDGFDRRCLAGHWRGLQHQLISRLSAHHDSLRRWSGWLSYRGQAIRHVNTQAVSVLAMALTCFTALMIPLSKSLPLEYVMMLFGGLSRGAFGTGANVCILKMRPRNSSPALQVFH
ncbi:hypothetical protein V5799_016523 [Amblyomma americanum]|uniref:Uncharacterized protein n=1 Tax=Amblyomma americanum TaxID=6943 RepID=A0AAQ4F5Y7_AMBAM